VSLSGVSISLLVDGIPVKAAVRGGEGEVEEAAARKALFATEAVDSTKGTMTPVVVVVLVVVVERVPIPNCELCCCC